MDKKLCGFFVLTPQNRVCLLFHEAVGDGALLEGGGVGFFVEAGAFGGVGGDAVEGFVGDGAGGENGGFADGAAGGDEDFDGDGAAPFALEDGDGEVAGEAPREVVGDAALAGVESGAEGVELLLAAVGGVAEGVLAVAGVAAGAVASRGAVVVGEGVEGFADVFFHTGVGGGGGLLRHVFIDGNGAEEALDLFGGGLAAYLFAVFPLFLLPDYFLFVGGVEGDFHLDVGLHAGDLQAQEEDGEQEVEYHGAHDAAAVSYELFSEGHYSNRMALMGRILDMSTVGMMSMRTETAKTPMFRRSVAQMSKRTGTVSM